MIPTTIERMTSVLDPANLVRWIRRSCALPSDLPLVSEPLFDHVVAPANLTAAWRRVRRNGGAAGADGLAVVTFSAGAEWRLRRLRRALKEGWYRPGPIRLVSVPKRSGGLRQLSIPCVVDRIAQTAVGLVLMPRLDPLFDGASFGYRPGRSAAMALQAVTAHADAGFGWVVDGDIETFFDVVPHDPMMERLASFISDRRLLDLIEMWLAAWAPAGRGLAQGAPLSPLLSNLYLDAVDRWASDLGRARFVRYADDFVLLCSDRRSAERTCRNIARELKRHGLRLNTGKTRILPFDAGFSFLGHVFPATTPAASVPTLPGSVLAATGEDVA